MLRGLFARQHQREIHAVPLCSLLEWLSALLGAPGDQVGPAMVLGAIWIVLGQLVGFLVCWVGWHVMKR